ncbi:MAG: ABC transporter permease [Sphaerobacter sp.]|nr:ABC transporter permease [Sphaerobacter sp.]
MADVRPERVTETCARVPTTARGAELSRVARTKARSNFQQAWTRFRRNHLAVGSLVVVVLIFAFGFSAPLISRYVTHVGYDEQVLLDKFLRPGEKGHLLGTDNLGRDVLTRLAYGARVSMTVALLAVASALLLGGTLGALAGYYGRWIDSVTMRFVDIMLSIPALFLLIFIGTLFPVGPTTLALVIAAVSWMGLARLIRGEIMSVKRRDYVEAARVLGASDGRIIVRHIIPNVTPIVIVWATLALPSFILVEAALSFLGLGVQVPVPSLGNMLSGAITYLSHSWTLIVIPGLVIYLTVLAINLVGNGLRDALDPRLGEQ